MNKKLKRISYTFVAMASICFATGIAVLSHTEGDETVWTD
nr:MAG TPA: hypothetical protein [Bacteriophage sp.]